MMKQSVDLMNLMILMKRIHSYAHLHLKRNARCAALLVAMLCCVEGAWAQTQVRMGTINNQEDIATYNQMMAECPMDITPRLGALSTWKGNNVMHTQTNGQHWNGTTEAYTEQNDGWSSNNWTASMTKTITLPEGKYLFIGPARSAANVQAYFRVGNLSTRVHHGGDTGWGINTSGQPSFNTGDTFANNNNGRGWRYTYIQFELAAETNVTFKIDATVNNSNHQWMSFTNPRLLSSSDISKYITVDHMVTHKVSYLKEYADQYKAFDLAEQGLASDAESDWWSHETGTQRVNHFEITHYVKQGETVTVGLPTTLKDNYPRNEHRYYQRWYNYEDESSQGLERLRNHVYFYTANNATIGTDGTPYQRDVACYLYQNGIVTGDGLYWDQSLANYNKWVLYDFNFTNTDGQPLTVAADVSRYKDRKYKNASAPLSDDLEEASLTMRYIFYMRDAKEMAERLTAKTENNTLAEPWLETKTFHFPAKPVFYENSKDNSYKGEFIGLRHFFSDYWVFDGNGTGNNNLVSSVNSNTTGKIEVVINDPNGTGITKGGWNNNGFYRRTRIFPWQPTQTRMTA